MSGRCATPSYTERLPGLFKKCILRPLLSFSFTPKALDYEIKYKKLKMFVSPTNHQNQNHENVLITKNNVDKPTIIYYLRIYLN
jgi:hypothetical protein